MTLQPPGPEVPDGPQVTSGAGRSGARRRRRRRWWRRGREPRGPRLRRRGPGSEPPPSGLSGRTRGCPTGNTRPNSKLLSFLGWCWALLANASREPLVAVASGTAVGLVPHTACMEKPRDPVSIPLVIDFFFHYSVPFKPSSFWYSPGCPHSKEGNSYSFNKY